MYTEGIQIGLNSYLLSDEDGTLTLLNGTCTQEEIEEYIKLQNEYEEKQDEKSNLQNDLSEINNKDRLSKKANIEIILSLLLIEGVFIAVGAGANLDLTSFIQLLGFPLFATLVVVLIGKPMLYGTKKKRTKQKAEINSRLEKVFGEIKEIEKKKQKLKEKVECESYFWEDEIIPVTTVENTKANVKMRVLKLDGNSI